MCHLGGLSLDFIGDFVVSLVTENGGSKEYVAVTFKANNSSADLMNLVGHMLKF